MINAVEILRLLHNLIRLGDVAEVDHGLPGERAPRVRVKAGAITTGWIRWIADSAGSTRDWTPPSVGEQVVLLSPGGDLAAAVALPSLYSNSHPAPSADPHRWLRVFSDNAVIEYDHEEHIANIDLPDGATLNLVSNGGLKITGDIELIGSLIATGEVSDGVRSMAADRDIYNEHDHAGDSGGTTAGPNQQQ